MTVYKGVLLFDIAEPAIGHWENELGWRGMREQWHHNETGDCVCLDPDDSEPEECWEFWVHDKDDGNYDSIAFGHFDKVDAIAKEWMKQHPDGWKE